MMFKLNLLTLNLLFTISLLAQNQLISPFLGDITPNQQATDFLMQKPETINVNYVNLDLSLLSNASNFRLTFDDQDYTVNNDRIEQRGYNNYSWFGSNADNDGHIIISVLGDDVQGIIRKGLETYELLTTAVNLRKVMVKIDQSQFPEEAQPLLPEEPQSQFPEDAQPLNEETQLQLISPFLGDITQNQPATEALMQQPETINVKYVDLNLSLINNSSNLQLTFDDQNYIVNNDSIVIRGPQNYSWFGTNINNDGYIIITVLGNDVQGIIRKGLETYELLTTSMNERKVVVKIDQSQYPEEYCVFENTNVNDKAATISETNYLKEALDTGCPIRALVMYTAAAEADLDRRGALATNIKNYIQKTVEELNVTFERSKVTNYPAVEIALIEKWDYVEDTSKNIVIERDNFKNNADVNKLRADYDADFCLLIAEDSDFYGYCGIAFDIEASRSGAFGVVANNCMQNNYSFAHELGHLLGADHDVDWDVAPPYPYAHGYIYFTGKWRTIMSYNLPCKAKGYSCKRIGYWSNPNVNHPTDLVPMGTDSLENNARVLRDYNNTFAQFEQPANNIILSNSNYNSANNNFTKLEIKQTINTNGNLTVNDDACFYLSAGESVNLNSGFESKPKADIYISIEQFEDCK